MRGMSKVLTAAGVVLALTGCGLAPIPLYFGPAQTRESAQAGPVEVTAPVVVQPSAEEKSLEDLYKRVNPSVVNIRVVSRNQGGQIVEVMPGFGFQQQPQVQVGEGSGFVYDSAGHVITNNHVVAGADKITVTFSDGSQTSATLIGASPDADLAVLRLEGDLSRLTPLPLAESDAARVGQSVVAIGNPFGLEGSMSTGIVSGLGRLLDDGGQAPDGQRYSIPDVIQTDAAINPGNSGGPLLDLAGNVLGVNTAIESPVRGSAGVGYAIPADIVRQVVPDLIKSGHYAFPYLGISGATLDVDLAQVMHLGSDQHGILVIGVGDGGPAADAGLRGSDRQVVVDGLTARIGGDVITAINDQPVRQFDDLISYLVRHTHVGDTVTLSILRDGHEHTLAVVVRARPSPSP